MRGSGFQTALAGTGLILLSLAVGCGRPPQVAGENLQLISSLRTALSAEDEQWLDENEQVIEQRHSTGEMSDEEHEAFLRIIATARSGEWDRAEKAAVRFQQAQRPKQEFVGQNPRIRPQAN